MALAFLALLLGSAAQGEVERTPAAALSTAVATCERWILDPATWVDGASRFPERSSLARDGLVVVRSVPARAEVPPVVAERRGLNYFRIGFAGGAVWITASDTMPVCHAAAFADANNFEMTISMPGDRWTDRGEETRRNIRSRNYQHLRQTNLFAITSTPLGERSSDRPKALVTLFMNLPAE